MLSLMTGCPAEMGSCCLFSQPRALSSGAPCWKRPMQSKCVFIHHTSPATTNLNCNPAQDTESTETIGKYVPQPQPTKHTMFIQHFTYP